LALPLALALAVIAKALARFQGEETGGRGGDAPGNGISQK
jgi:hypothetical protein